MTHSIPREGTPRPRSLSSIGRLDRLALYVTTAVVLFFAVYPILFFGERSSFWPFGASRRVTLNDFLTIILSLEAFLVVWLWLEMPRRHKAESALRKIHSVQRAISQASGRIVNMSREELEQGLQRELCAIREMLNVDRASWFQQSDDETKYVRVHASSSEYARPAREEFAAAEIPWIVKSVFRGAPIHVRRTKDLPQQDVADRTLLERNGILRMEEPQVRVRWC
jgi:hypothetical protein